MNKVTDFKRKYDKIFDDLFFTNEFRDYCVKEMKRCPAGLTINTIDDEQEGKYFKTCCKKYGYDFSGDRIIGDYTFGEKLDDIRYTETCLNYLYDKNREVFDYIMNNYEVY